MKRCRKCSTLFEPVRPLQVVCSPACSLAWAQTLAGQKAEKRARAIDKREARAKLETPAEAARKAQAVFNRWVRLVDARMPCVSCGHPDDGSRQRHASHYRPAGPNPALRFEPDNTWASCARCNSHLSGNLTAYRLELIRRIGIERVEWLEGPHDLPHRTVADFREIQRHYARLCRQLEKLEPTNAQHPPQADPMDARAGRDDPPGHRGDQAAVARRPGCAGAGG